MIKAFRVFIDITSDNLEKQIILALPFEDEDTEYNYLYEKSLERSNFNTEHLKCWRYDEIPLGMIKVSDLTIEDFILLQKTIIGGVNNEQN